MFGRFCFFKLFDWLKKKKLGHFLNPQSIKPKINFVFTGIVFAGFMHLLRVLLRVLIGTLCCLRLLQLSTVVLGFASQLKTSPPEVFFRLLKVDLSSGLILKVKSKGTERDGYFRVGDSLSLKDIYERFFY